MLTHHMNAAGRPLDAPPVAWRRAIQGSNITALARDLAGRARFMPIGPAPFLVRAHAIERPNISILVVASEASYRMRCTLEPNRVALAYADFARSFAAGAGRCLAPGAMLLVRGGTLDARALGKSGIVVVDFDPRAFPELRAVLPSAARAVLTAGDRLATMRLRGCVRAIASMCESEYTGVSEGVMHRIVEGELVACLHEAIAASTIGCDNGIG